MEANMFDPAKSYQLADISNVFNQTSNEFNNHVYLNNATEVIEIDDDMDECSEVLPLNTNDSQTDFLPKMNSEADFLPKMNSEADFLPKMNSETEFLPRENSETDFIPERNVNETNMLPEIVDIEADLLRTVDNTDTNLPPKVGDTSEINESDLWSQVPPGCIYVHEKWNDSDLVFLLSRRVNPVAMDSLDFVDFFPITNFAVVFVTEADLVGSTSYKRNLAKLKKANYEKTTVIVERTKISSQYFDEFQKFAVLELGLGLLPVSGITECCNALVSIVRMGSEDKNTPFMMKKRAPPLDTYLLRVLLCVPSLGETKAQALMLNFKSLYNICNASLEDLTRVIGRNSAEKVHDFFHKC